MWRQAVELRLKQRPSWEFPPGDPSHIQTPNSDTIKDGKKCLMTGACYSCLLRSSAWDWWIQRQMLAATLWNEHRVPNWGVRERTEGAKWICNNWKKNYVNQPDAPELTGTKPLIKEYTWRDPGLQLHMYQRMPLSVINRRRGPWSCEGSIPQCRGMPGQGDSSVCVSGELS